MYFRGSFQFSIVPIKKISLLWKPDIHRVFSKLKISYFYGKILPISLKLNFTPKTLGCYGLSKVKFGVLV